MLNHTPMLRDRAVNGTSFDDLAQTHDLSIEVVRRIFRQYGHEVPPVSRQDELAGL